jgi:hypothetical protein
VHRLQNDLHDHLAGAGEQCRQMPSGSSFVLDCANDRREYGAASASGDHL